MKNKNKKKGFTLIELLVTILVMSLVAVVGFIAVRNAINNSKEKSNSVNINSIVSSARSYTEEFKGQDKYWFVDPENTDEEYSCTTVEMLINKGYLKENILNTKIDNNAITKDTSILIKRNRSTKVNISENITFNSENCDSESDVKIAFEVSGNTGNSGWYIDDVSIKIIATNLSQIDKEYTNYGVINDGKREPAIISEAKNESAENWEVKVGNEGKNVDFCVIIKDYKDKYDYFCLSDDDKIYNMDKTKPTISDLILNTTENNYVIKPSGASDNVTAPKNLKYYINYDENTNEEEHLLGLDTRVNDKTVSTYIEDEAGNKSDTITKNLTITDSENATPTSRIEYTCSLDNNPYSDEGSATNACKKQETGTVTENTYYKCSFNDTRYTDKASASSDCTKTVQGTITREKDSYTDTEYVDGSCTHYYKCTTSHVWGTRKTKTCTNNGCPSGYTKQSYSCEPNGHLGSCSTVGDTTEVYQSCTNTCAKTITTYSYYCDVTSSYVASSSSDCSTTETGTVSSGKDYSCSFDSTYYSQKADAVNACVKQITGTVGSKNIYTCPLDKKDYSTNDEATKACTNYCKTGNYYSNSCYNFN